MQDKYPQDLWAMPTHHPHPPLSVPLTLATTTDRTLCCEKCQLEKMLKSYQKKGKVIFSQWSTVKALACILSPFPIPHPLTPCHPPLLIHKTLLKGRGSPPFVEKRGQPHLRSPCHSLDSHHFWDAPGLCSMIKLPGHYPD